MFSFFLFIHQFGRCLAVASSIQQVSWTLLDLGSLWKEREWKREPNQAACGEHTFFIQCFVPVWVESHDNREPRGEKSVRRLAKLHPSGIRAQTLQSHDKNNIPHVSDGL